MFKAILFKEWIKIRVAFFGLLAISFLMLINILLNLSHEMKFVAPRMYWYNVVFRQLIFYSGLMYIPVVTGIVLALAQFIPEMTSNRLKLTLHLPVKENNVLLQMISIGFVATLSIFVVTLLLLTVIILVYFPTEVYRSVLITSAPWFLAGIAGYFSVAMLVTEPLWIKRILLIPIVYGFLEMFFYLFGYNAYEKSLPEFAVLSFLFGISILYSGYRFRKGVM